MEATKVDAAAIMDGDPDMAMFAYEAIKLFETMDSFIMVYFGEPCPEYEPECVICKMWAQRNALAAVVSDQAR